MKVLLLPLFTFPTGHSKVSHTMGEWILKKYPHAEVVERDLLSYSQPKIEKFIASFYLRWLHLSPKSYGFIYNHWIGKQKRKQNPSKWARIITAYFEKKLYKMIQKLQPDMIFCTHSFASRVSASVKRKYHLNIPIVNVYTDLFINGVWEVEAVDYHFVPTIEAKKEIQSMHQVEAANIFVTGIPIHPDFTEKPITTANQRAHVLVAGGNTGLLDVNYLRHLIQRFPKLQFTILCGKNKKLYNEIQSLASPTVRIKTYVETAKEMNALYDTVDAIISKPGGVTISEVIHKKIPFYISHYLPGPEEMNVAYLVEHQMATCVTMEHLTNTHQTKFCNPIALEKMIRQMQNHRVACSDTIPVAIDTIVQQEQKKTQMTRTPHLGGRQIVRAMNQLSSKGS